MVMEQRFTQGGGDGDGERRRQPMTCLIGRRSCRILLGASWLGRGARICPRGGVIGGVRLRSHKRTHEAINCSACVACAHKHRDIAPAHVCWCDGNEDTTAGRLLPVSNGRARFCRRPATRAPRAELHFLSPRAVPATSLTSLGSQGAAGRPVSPNETKRNECFLYTTKRRYTK